VALRKQLKADRIDDVTPLLEQVIFVCAE